MFHGKLQCIINELCTSLLKKKVLLYFLIKANNVPLLLTFFLHALLTIEKKRESHFRLQMTLSLASANTTNIILPL